MVTPRLVSDTQAILDSVLSFASIRAVACSAAYNFPVFKGCILYC